MWQWWSFWYVPNLVRLRRAVKIWRVVRWVKDFDYYYYFFFFLVCRLTVHYCVFDLWEKIFHERYVISMISTFYNMTHIWRLFCVFTGSVPIDYIHTAKKKVLGALPMAQCRWPNAKAVDYCRLRGRMTDVLSLPNARQCTALLSIPRSTLW